MRNLVRTSTMVIGLTLLLSALLYGCAQNTPAPTAEPAQAQPTATNPPPTKAPTATSAPTATTAPTPEPKLSGDPVRGGLLYDNWFAELGMSAPEGDHPLWKTQTSNTRSGPDTWRCKECHGWDYKGVDGAYGSGSHRTGFMGILQSASKPGWEVLASLQGSTNPDHDFSGLMDEQDLTDLALFITDTLLDASELVNEDKTAKGEAAAGEDLYIQVCTHCHGPQGSAINFGSYDELEFVGALALDNPWEFIHKVRYGQAGWPMPSAIRNEWSNEDVAAVMAYAQTLSNDPMASLGGQLYDKWWTVVGGGAPSGDSPLWSTQTTNTRSGEDTWRCKECHGWDYKGVDGAYGSGSHRTGFKGILAASSLSAEEIIGALTGQKNPDHDFSEWLDEAALNELVTFIQDEIVDTASIINADKTIAGDPTQGEQKYINTCAHCHGADGKKLNFGSSDEPEYIGTLALDNPWEFFHKVYFGQPGQPMPIGQAMGWAMEEIADLIAFAQTLPAE